MGFERIEDFTWEIAMARFSILAGPLEIELRQQDLRWMAGQIRAGRLRKLPGRPALVKRWRCSDRQVRNTLRSAWQDPYRNESGQKADSYRTESGQLPDSSVTVQPTEEPESGQLPDRKRTATGQKAATRASDTPDTRTPDTRTPDKRRRLPPGAFDRLATRWKEIKPGGLPLDPKKGIGKAMAARIRDHGEENVRTVIDWYANSSHDRADYLRKSHSLGTLMVAKNFETYFEMSQNPTSGSRGMSAHPDDDNSHRNPRHNGGYSETDEQREARQKEGRRILAMLEKEAKEKEDAE